MTLLLRCRQAVTLLVLLVAGLAVATGKAPPSQQVVWPQYLADAQHTGRSAFQGPQSCSLAWNATLGVSYSDPIIGSDGTIYISNDEDLLLAIDPTSGQTKWTLPHLGSSGTVLYSWLDGSIIVGNLSKSFVTTIVSVDTTTQKVNWDWSPTNEELKPGYPVTLSDDGTTVFVMGTLDKKHRPVVVYALKTSDGSVLWNQTLPHRDGFGGDPPSLSSTYVTPGLLYVPLLYSFIAVDATNGTVVWEFSYDNFYGVGTASPTVDPGSDRVFLSSPDGTVYGLNGTTGEVLWEYSPSAGPGSLVAPVLGYKGLLYVLANYDWKDSSSSLYALSGDLGTLAWNVSVGVSLRPPALGADDTIYIGTEANGLLAVDGTTGAVVWAVEGKFGSSPAINLDGSLTLTSTAGGLLTFASQGGIPCSSARS